MKYSNCLIYAISKYIKCKKEMGNGGFLVFRKSKYGWWFHVLHMDTEGVITEFSPIKAKIKRLFPPLLFKGEIKNIGRLCKNDCNHLKKCEL